MLLGPDYLALLSIYQARCWLLVWVAFLHAVLTDVRGLLLQSEGEGASEPAASPSPTARMGPLPSLSAGEEQGLAALQARWRGFNTRRRLGKGHTKRSAPALPSSATSGCDTAGSVLLACLSHHRNVSPDCTRLPACRGFPTCLASDSRSVRCGVRRHRIAEELLITEDTYVKGLRSLVTLYIQPMREMLGTPEEVRARRRTQRLCLGCLGCCCVSSGCRFCAETTLHTLACENDPNPGCRGASEPLLLRPRLV
eukprot:COSAG04_NODE_3642_length_2648_cov_1.630836_3_plen_254_part_00